MLPPEPLGEIAQLYGPTPPVATNDRPPRGRTFALGGLIVMPPPTERLTLTVSPRASVTATRSPTLGFAPATYDAVVGPLLVRVAPELLVTIAQLYPGFPPDAVS